MGEVDKSITGRATLPRQMLSILVHWTILLWNFKKQSKSITVYVYYIPQSTTIITSTIVVDFITNANHKDMTSYFCTMKIQ